MLQEAHPDTVTSPSPVLQQDYRCTVSIEELLRSAWRAVEAAEMPEHVQSVAFVKAFEHLAQSPEGQQQRGDGTGRAAEPKLEEPRLNSTSFFERLSNESAVGLQHLQQIFHNDAESNAVEILLPSRRLGSSTAEQARTVIVLVAGARFGGLAESPVAAKAVRAECARKGCYNSKKFSSDHAADLAGFNLRKSAEFIINPAWVKEFSAAVRRVLSLEADGAE